MGHAKVQLAVAHEIMSGQSGKLIVQNMGMEAMNCTLFEKEQPKNKDRTAIRDRTTLFPKNFG